MSATLPAFVVCVVGGGGETQVVKPQIPQERQLAGEGTES